MKNQIVVFIFCLPLLSFGQTVITQPLKYTTISSLAVKAKSDSLVQAARISKLEDALNSYQVLVLDTTVVKKGDTLTSRDKALWDSINSVAKFQYNLKSALFKRMDSILTLALPSFRTDIDTLKSGTDAMKLIINTLQAWIDEKQKIFNQLPKQ